MSEERRKDKKQKVDNLGEMSLLEHLDEFRRRLVKVVIALAVGVIVGLVFAERVLEMLVVYLGTRPYADSPTGPASVYFKVAVVIGVIVAMPVIVYQVFQFAAPGLERNERRYIIIGTPAVSLLFVAGVAFAAVVALPRAIPFLQGFLSSVVDPRYKLDSYISFVSNVLIWSGLVFETPLVMFVLAKLGVIDYRGFAKAWRIVVVGGAVGAAVITPTVDPVSMLLVMGPFLLLYGLGILLARFA
jgi:sec-independent protein translocase protein TatC